MSKIYDNRLHQNSWVQFKPNKFEKFIRNSDSFNDHGIPGIRRPKKNIPSNYE